jgi:Domain of unknown function (DUF932)
MDNVVQLPLPDKNNPFSKFNTPSSPILFAVGECRVGWELRNASFLPTESHKAIVRVNPQGDPVKLLNVVGTNYRLVHNRELFTQIEDCMINEMLPEHLVDVQVEDKVSGYGRICYREYRFPNIRCYLANVRSNIGFRIIVQNGYGGTGLRILSGAIDYFCTNGMVSGEHLSTYRKHTSGLVISDLSGHITKSLQMFADAQTAWQKWTVTPVAHNPVMALFDAVSMSKKMREGLIDQYAREREARGTNLWSVYSALTYYASHSDGTFNLRKTVEEQDSVAQTMLARELNVAKWVKTPEWRALECYGPS